MSHSQGAVRFDDGTIYFFEYNGTVDVCLPKLYKTPEELYANWRNQRWDYHDENCKEEEIAIMASTYGGGFGWTVKACKRCMLITDNHSSEAELEDEYNRYDDLPDWYPNREKFVLRR